MIIYGTKAVTVASKNIDTACPHCGTQHAMNLWVVETYGHLFWIPFFPNGKTAVSECRHCKQVLRLNEMPMWLQNEYYELKKTAKVKIWMYSGIALAVVLIIVGVISVQQEKAANKKMVADPRPGDIYELSSGGGYSLLKVEEIKADTVYAIQSLYESNRSGEMSKIEEKGFSNEVVPFVKEEIQKMFDDDKIIDVKRRK
jgi:hypothetical protein